MKGSLALALTLTASAAAAQLPTERGDTLYRTTLYRAAPGRLLQLIDALQASPAPERGRLILRHSQGDHWDLMVLSRAESLDAERDASAPPGELVAWREDTFVTGPDLAPIEAVWSASLYHVEMFHALAGRRAELLKQREMENEYAGALKRPTNAIFVRVIGGSWDCFTLGAYRSWTHFAQSDGIPPERADAAAEAAGFAGGDRIGTYLRELIADHHDTLATPVR